MFIECLFSSVCALVFITHFHETLVKASYSLKLFQAHHPWGEMEGLQRSRDWCWRPSECHCDRQEDIVDLGMVHLECQQMKFPLGDTAMSVRHFQRWNWRREAHLGCWQCHSTGCGHPPNKNGKRRVQAEYQRSYLLLDCRCSVTSHSGLDSPKVWVKATPTPSLAVSSWVFGHSHENSKCVSSLTWWHWEPWFRMLCSM